VICPLCASKTFLFFTDSRTEVRYFHCHECDLRFLEPNRRLSSAAEKARYELHDNQATNLDYREYISSIAQWVQAHTKNGASGLDYGCGDGPVLAQILAEHGHMMDIYDPFFYPDRFYATKRYDFVTAIESAEHFYAPAKEFSHFKKILKEKGGVGIVTALYNKNIDFENWYYRRDPTHVCFYSQQTFDWLKEKMYFTAYDTDGVRLNWLSN
jgi:hypothetical protein